MELVIDMKHDSNQIWQVQAKSFI